ncbi:PQQ-dependent sugar dehydrogenase [Maribacter arcticus]|uniref:Glucose / Sorbosone dehydrogenase n=1 Tax=Maribacter arcticus TaxID=561365 RepID=A0A1T5CUJ0_9FLAO|nr:PQQ-dependent sugar dehydrogenase [Maribacter arcticus]SKB63003.1 Glucose / Sorbosone dehydrogenase [Maribacter arcticus]
MKIKLIYLTLALVFLSCNQAKKKTSTQENVKTSNSNSIRLELLTDALKNPIQMSIPNDNTHRKFLTNRGGQIWILENKTVLPIPFLQLNTAQDSLGLEGPEGIGTINGMAFHPQFSTNYKFYVCYNAAPSIANDPIKLVISEFLVDEDNPNLTNKESEIRILEVEGENIANNGGKIAFGPDGYLYISIGDDAIGDENYVHHAQDLNHFNGKILRINVNTLPYSIPSDNPFAGISDAKPEIWAYGLRKMWRYTFDPKSKQLFGADVGEGQQEEINIVTKGANLGWPYMEGESVYMEDNSIHKSGFKMPINTYSHEDGVCIIGGNFYYGKENPYLQNKLVFGDFRGSIFSLTKETNGKWTRELLEIQNKLDDVFLICGFDTDEENELYVMGFSNTNVGPKGAIYKIMH